jgi:hypothetical protein
MRSVFRQVERRREYDEDNPVVVVALRQRPNKSIAPQRRTTGLRTRQSPLANLCVKIGCCPRCAKSGYIASWRVLREANAREYFHVEMDVDGAF